MAEKKKTGIIVFIVILIIAALIGALGLVKMFSTDSKEDKQTQNSSGGISQIVKTLGAPSSSSKTKTPKPKNEYIAKLVISGTIEEANQTYNQKWLLKTISRLKEDKNNKAIILFINSPGGTVYQADEVYLALLDYKSTGKVLYAYLGPLAASGGYYIACAADYIFANRNSLTGSIGVISGASLDLTGIMEKYGIKYTTITAGKNKNMGNINAPLTSEQKAIMQSIADEAYEQFTDIVAQSRNMKKSTLYPLADGRIYTAAQAKKHNLIDEVGTFDQALAHLKENQLDISINDDDEKTSKKDIELVTYEYKAEQSLYSYFMKAGEELSKSAYKENILPDAIEKTITPGISYPAYIYCSK